MTPHELWKSSTDLYTKGEFDKAASGFVEALRLFEPFRQQPSLLYFVGLTFGQDSSPQNAFVFFSRAIELEPGNAKFYGSRARALSACRAYGAAIDDIEKAVELDSDFRNKLASLKRKIREDFARPRYSVAISASDFMKGLGGKVVQKAMICPSCCSSFPEEEHLESDGAWRCPGCGYRIPLDLLKKKNIVRKQQETADANSAVDLDAAKRLGYCWDCCKADPSGAYTQDGSGRRRCRACCSKLGPLLDH